MKTNSFLLICLVLIFGISSAQVTQSTGQLASNASTCGDLDALFTQSGQSMHNLMFSDYKSNNLTGKSLNVPVKGSPYLGESFISSTIYHEDKLLGKCFTRYNAFSQEIEIKRTLLAEENFKALIKDPKIRVVQGNKEYRFTEFIDNKGNRQDGYLIAINNGPTYKLYERHKVRYVEGKKAENSMTNDIPSRFTASTDYYLEDLNTSLVSQIPTKKSKFISMFKKRDQFQVATLIKKNSFSIKKNQDLLKILEMANNLSPDLAIKE